MAGNVSVFSSVTPRPVTPLVVTAVGKTATAEELRGISSTLVKVVELVKVKVVAAAVYAPPAKPVNVPLMVPLVICAAGTLAATVPAANPLKASATSAAVLAPVEVYVKPATVTDWPAVRAWNVTTEDSVTPPVL